MDKKKTVLILLLIANAQLLIARTFTHSSLLYVLLSIYTAIISLLILILPSKYTKIHVLRIPIVKVIYRSFKSFILTFSFLIESLLDSLLAIFKLFSDTYSSIYTLLAQWSDHIMEFLMTERNVPKIPIPHITIPLLRKKKSLRTKTSDDVFNEEVESFEDESIKDIITWWFKTPIFPNNTSDWMLAVMIVFLCFVFFYFSFERLLSGYRGLEMFYIWHGKF